MRVKKINSWELEQYLLSELPGERMKEIDIQLKEDPALREEIECLKNSNKEILEQYPPDSVVPQILNRLHLEKTKESYSRSPFFKRLLIAAPAFAVVVLVFLMLPVIKDILGPGTQGTPTDGTRIKGEETIDMTKPNLIVYRQKNDLPELLKKGTTAKAGDLLQIGYVAGEQSHGVILSIDGNGVVTLHFPDGKTQSTALEKKKKVLLQSAYELDDAPAFERFFFITSQSEIDVESVLAQVKKLAKHRDRAQTADIELKDPLKQTSFLVNK